MPKFAVWAHYTCSRFVRDVEAESAEEAVRLVEEANDTEGDVYDEDIEVCYQCKEFVGDISLKRLEAFQEEA